MRRSCEVMQQLLTIGSATSSQCGISRIAFRLTCPLSAPTIAKPLWLLQAFINQILSLLAISFAAVCIVLMVLLSYPDRRPPL